MNITDAENIVEQFEELQRMAAPIAKQLIAIQHRSDYHVDPDQISVEDGALMANWETFCCGDSEYHDIYIPLKYLFDEDWQKDAQEQIDKQRAAEAEVKRVRAEKAKLATAERERQQYLKLKEKFGE